MAQRVPRQLRDLHGEVHQRPSVADLGIYVGRSPPPADQRITFEQWLAGAAGYWGFLNLTGTLVALAGGARLNLRAEIPQVAVLRWLIAIGMPAGAVLSLRGGVPAVQTVLPSIEMPNGAALALTGGVPGVAIVTWAHLIGMVAGARFEARAGSPAVAVVPPPVAGSLDFETTSLTPYQRTGAYVSALAWDGSIGTQRVTDSVHGGTYAMKFVFSASAYSVRLYRAITMPSSGIVTFERWFRFTPPGADGRSVDVSGFASDSAVSAWIAGVRVMRGGATAGVAVWAPSYQTVLVVPYASLVSGDWYRVVLALNCGTNRYTTTVYNATGTQMGQVADQSPISNFAGLSIYSILGNNNTGESLWIDDLNDGV